MRRFSWVPVDERHSRTLLVSPVSLLEHTRALSQLRTWQLEAVPLWCLVMSAVPDWVSQFLAPQCLALSGVTHNWNPQLYLSCIGLCSFSGRYRVLCQVDAAPYAL